MAQAKAKSSPRRRPVARKKSVADRPSAPRRSNSSKSAPSAAVSNAAGKATTVVGNAADKAKIQLVAGGVALGRRHAHRHSRMDRAIKLAHELQQVRQPADGRHRSPLEVVLEGLTARRSRA